MPVHKRTWSITRVWSSFGLARKLARHTWTACTGFELAGTLWVNDSFSPDGHQAYSVIRKSDNRVIETFTVSMFDNDRELRLAIERILAGLDDHVDYGECDPRQFEFGGHERCYHCA